jgi:uncharacterized cupin superfamily protein
VTLAHWDDVEARKLQRGHIDSSWQFVGRAAGSIGVGVNRVRVEPDRWSTPAHFHTAEEEIFFILEGNGLSWQDGKAFEVRAGDCLVHRPRREAHTLRAGPEGLTFIAYGRRARGDAAHLPRAGVSWLSPAWTEAGQGEDPYSREAAVGEPEVGEIFERPRNIVNVDALEPDAEGDRVLAGTAGAKQSGLHHRTLAPGGWGVPAHCHSAEEEVFVLLEGGATLELIPNPSPAARGVAGEMHELRPGHVVARPPGTQVSHFIRAGDDGAVILVYGTREPNDIAYYPRSNKINIRGIGLIGRLEPLDYWDGEPERP